MSKIKMKLRKLFKARLSEDGFTLVELMVVVAIIALLAATALPQFRKYQAKSRVSEAKLALASLYTAEESYLGEYAAYATCMPYMGYIPTGDSADRYYTVGFLAYETSHLGVRADCASVYLTAAYLGIRMNVAIATSVLPSSEVNANNLSWIGGAIGIIDKDFIVAQSLTASSWTINQDKVLTEINSGY